ncbi:MAG: hypothetical protein KDA53_12480 [Hyphomonas sp.]|nr:hypothetical protein [Hyphomonas sp.]
MPLSTDAKILALTDGFRACTLPKEQWTHGAHWAAALTLLREDRDAAFRDMPGMIRAYNESCGGRNTKTEGYHETITLASLRAAAQALDEAPPDTPLSAVLASLLAGPCGKPDWILDYWSRERLFGVTARREWVEPDIRPLPF